ncbi:MAG: PQQ-binding-like beta-propeller repeat protein [Candidatus Nitrosopolaris sp.]
MQNVSAKLPVGTSNQPIKSHQQETIAAKKIIIPDGAADQNVEFYYQPKEVTISNNTSVTWVNQDSALHTATADNGSFDTGIIPIDAHATVLIIGSSKLDYHCTIHPWMQGTITVVSSSGYSSSQQNQLQHPGPLGKSATLTPYLLTTHKTLKLLPRSLTTDYGTEPEYKNDWITANHDIFGTRSSNQTIIGKDNVKNLQFKWILLNKSPIEDPPIIIGNRGYVQDNGGNIVAFDTNTGHILWKIHQGIGRNFHGLTYDHGVLFSGTGYNSTVIAVNATNGVIIWQSPVLGPSKAGYGVATPPIVWKDYVVVGSAGGDFPHDQSWQKGAVQGNITALNRTNGDIIWNFRTTSGEWVNPGKSPPNGGATAWSGGSFDPQSKTLYMPLGNPAPDFNASTRLAPNLYANHMVAVNITNGKLVWAVPFIAQGTVLKVRLPDTHDWDTSWGSSVSSVTYDNGTHRKMVIGHDKMGNLIAMNAATGKELWWETMGPNYHTETIPLPKGSSPVWTYGIDAYHAVDNHNSLYVTTNGRGLNYFTNGLSGHRTPLINNSIGLGFQNGTITAIDMRTGMIKWNYRVDFPPLVSPLVTQGLVFSGYIPFTETAKSSHIEHPIRSHQIRTGVVLALDNDTGKKMWTATVKGSIGVGGASVGGGMLFVPTGKVQSYKGVGGSIVAFGLP